MLATLLLLTATASATDAAVAPFLAWGVDAEDALTLSGQIVQEMDFMGVYGSVFALEFAPPGLDAACLASAPCMAGAADTAMTDHLLAGQVSGTPETYDVFAVLFDAETGSFVRQHRFQIAASAIADELGGQVRFLVTGEQGGAAATTSADFLEDDDDFSFADPAPASEPIEVPTTALELDDDPYYDDYQEIPTVARYRSEPEANSASLSLPSDAPETEPRERSEPRSDRRSERDDTPVREAATERDESFDKPRIDSVFSFTARVGYARYQSLNFVSWGGEFGIEALQPVRLNIGLEAQSAPLPIEGSENDFGVPQVEWRSVLPLNIGAVYVFYTDTLTPYVGGDLTLTAYTSSFDTAPGVRLRGGFDYMTSEHFGINVNLSAGMWFGTDTSTNEDISVELSNLGLAPAFSIGTVLAF